MVERSFTTLLLTALPYGGNATQSTLKTHPILHLMSGHHNKFSTSHSSPKSTRLLFDHSTWLKRHPGITTPLTPNIIRTTHHPPQCRKRTLNNQSWTPLPKKTLRRHRYRIYLTSPSNNTRRCPEAETWSRRRLQVTKKKKRERSEREEKKMTTTLY